MTLQKKTLWGLQVFIGEKNGIETWVTMPKYNHYGGVRREIGESFKLDGVTYTVMSVTPSAALCKQTAAKVVKYITDDGVEKERKVNGSRTIRVAAYRERNHRIDRGGTGCKRLLRGATLAS